jgi:hypothetical protein
MRLFRFLHQAYAESGEFIERRPSLLRYDRPSSIYCLPWIAREDTP